MYVRPLTRSDVGEFRALRLRAIEDSPAAFLQTSDDFAAMTALELEKWIEQSEDRVTVGAFDSEGRLIGLAGIKRDGGFKNRHKAMVWGVFVSPEARRIGAGRTMMEALFEEARKREGLLQLHLAVAESQTSARALYERLGFWCYGKEPRAVRVGEEFFDEYLMFLDLTTEP